MWGSELLNLCYKHFSILSSFTYKTEMFGPPRLVVVTNLQHTYSGTWFWEETQSFLLQWCVIITFPKSKYNCLRKMWTLLRLIVKMKSRRILINQELDKFNCIIFDFSNNSKQSWKPGEIASRHVPLSLQSSSPASEAQFPLVTVYGGKEEIYFKLILTQSMLGT